MKCKCGNTLYTIQVIPCCGDCDQNGAWDSDLEKYVIDLKIIEEKDLERNQVEECGECQLDNAFGAGCYIFVCNGCHKKTILPVVDGC